MVFFLHTLLSLLVLAFAYYIQMCATKIHITRPMLHNNTVEYLSIIKKFSSLPPPPLSSLLLCLVDIVVVGFGQVKFSHTSISFSIYDFVHLRFAWFALAPALSSHISSHWFCMVYFFCRSFESIGFIWNKMCWFWWCTRLLCTFNRPKRCVKQIYCYFKTKWTHNLIWQIKTVSAMEGDFNSLFFCCCCCCCFWARVCLQFSVKCCLALASTHFYSFIKIKTSQWNFKRNTHTQRRKRITNIELNKQHG